MKKSYPKAYNPLILRYHRLLEAFSKSDDERDFYLDKVEGFLLFIDLDKYPEKLDEAYGSIEEQTERYCLIPKLTLYETKKLMEGFVNEKVYDIDAKEKLLDIIGSREARENFLEFLSDNLLELDKWQQYYQERFRICIIEWLRKQDFFFVFEEDIEISKKVVEKVKGHIFDSRVSKEVQNARQTLDAKANSYYSNEALNPRPKRGRPPKQAAKVEFEPQFADDLYTTIPTQLRPFLFAPEYSSNAISFSTKFEDNFSSSKLKGEQKDVDTKLKFLSQRLESLRQMHRIKNVLPVAASETLDKAFNFEVEATEVKSERPLSNLFQGSLPKKRGRPPKGEGEKTKKDPAKIKKVTQIRYKKDK